MGALPAAAPPPTRCSATPAEGQSYQPSAAASWRGISRPRSASGAARRSRRRFCARPRSRQCAGRATGSNLRRNVFSRPSVPRVALKPCMHLWPVGAACSLTRSRRRTCPRAGPSAIGHATLRIKGAKRTERSSRRRLGRRFTTKNAPTLRTTLRTTHRAATQHPRRRSSSSPSARCADELQPKTAWAAARILSSATAFLPKRSEQCNVPFESRRRERKSGVHLPPAPQCIVPKRLKPHGP